MSLPEPSSDSVALVTGASSGIGEQFARQLSEMGHRVALVARRADRLASLAEELGGPDRAVAIGTDLEVPTERDQLAARIEELEANVEILVNNAGYGIYQPFPEAGREAELRQLRLLSEAVVDLMARYLPGMKERGRGTIINMSSTAAFSRSHTTPATPPPRRMCSCSPKASTPRPRSTVSPSLRCARARCRVASRRQATRGTSPRSCRSSRSSRPTGSPVTRSGPPRAAESP